MSMTIFTRATRRSFGALSLSVLAIAATACPEETNDDGDGGGGSAEGGSAGEGGGTTTTTQSSSSGAGGGSETQSTHVGLVSIQDMSIHGAPQAGHGLTVQAFFTPASAPVYEELPGSPAGCKAWVYDLETSPPPPPIDAGVLEIAGAAGGTIACSFQQNGAYGCPMASASGPASLAPEQNGTVIFTSDAAAFTQDDVGRYLRIAGTSAATNAGAFPIVAVPSPKTAVIVNQQAQAEDADVEFTVVAGAGPVPSNPVDPIGPGAALTVSLVAPATSPFQFGTTGAIVAGSELVVDGATAALLGAIPLDGAALSLGCGGAGGSCGEAALTVIRLTTTDGDTTGLSPFTMPPPAAKQIDLSCASLDPSGVVAIPAEAMAILQEIDESSPITRIRTAFMREGFAIVGNEAPLPPNAVRVLVGHGTLGFTDP